MSEGKDKIPSPTRKFEVFSQYELVDIDDLEEGERTAVLDAIAAYHQSNNPEFHAGAVAVAEDGTKVAMHNQEIGPEGHAEMLALKGLYKSVGTNPESKRELKFMVLAGSSPDVELMNGKRYTAETPLQEIAGECAWPCGRCLKFVNDYSAGRDVKWLIVTASGQVLRTSQKTLHPMPHKTSSVSLEPLKEGAYSPGYNPDTDPTRKLREKDL